MKYNKQLDGLRFIAVSSVLFSHFFWSVGSKMSIGFFGVDLFFVISGFLITSILLKSEESFRQAYKKFIGRRTLRIFPIYYLAICLLYVLGNDSVNANIGYLLSYTYNYTMAYKRLPADELGHLWSLCVEEQFYLFWPFVVLGLRNKLLVLKISIGVIVGLCIVQVLFGYFNAFTPHNYYCTFPRILSLITGAFGAILYKENRMPVSILENKWIELCMFLSLMMLLFIEKPINYVCFPILSLFLVMKTMNKGFKFSLFDKLLLNRHVVFIGTISYGVYLYHIFIQYYFGFNFFDTFVWNRIDFKSLGWLRKLEYNEILVTFPLYTAVTIGIAYFSFRYIERPILSLKDRWFPYEKKKLTKVKMQSLLKSRSVEKV